MKRRVTGLCLLFVCVVLVGSSWGAVTFQASGIDGSNIASYLIDGSINTSIFGHGAGFVGDDNSIFGSFAGQNTVGDYNSFFGSHAGYSNHGGQSNSFFGYNAGYNNGIFGGEAQPPNYNSFFGVSAGYNNMTGQTNNFFGHNAGYYNNSGSNNSYFGQDSGVQNITGNNNTFIGVGSGTYTKGSGNVFLGYGAGYTRAVANNTLIIDNCINGAPCNFPFIEGNFSARYLELNGTVTVDSLVSVSDERYKRNIQPLQLSLDKVIHLNGVSYEWKTAEYKGKGFREGRQIGLIAQEVEKIFPELVQTDDKGYKAVAYDKLVPVLIEAVKEQQKSIVSQKNEIAAFNEKLSQALRLMEQRITALESPAKTVALK
ncbi:MAG: tail fiber domain-containing protein [Thermodesulfovibrionales bacterium]